MLNDLEGVLEFFLLRLPGMVLGNTLVGVCVNFPVRGRVLCYTAPVLSPWPLSHGFWSELPPKVYVGDLSFVGPVAHVLTGPEGWERGRPVVLVCFIVKCLTRFGNQEKAAVTVQGTKEWVVPSWSRNTKE